MAQKDCVEKGGKARSGQRRVEVGFLLIFWNIHMGKIREFT
jgi:hypothetical protein